MKITSLTKKLGAAFLAGGLMIPAAVNAAPLHSNLLIDPGFEDVGTPGGVGAYLNSWQDGSGTDYAYAVSANYDNGNPLAGGGAYYFNSNFAAPAGDVTAPGVVSQLVDVSTGDTAAAIAAGTAKYVFNGFFSTFATNDDSGTMFVEFLDAGNTSLGTDSISPGANVQDWTFLSSSGNVPAGTASVLVSLYGTVHSGGGGPDGYIDNVSFSVVPEPTSMLLAGLGLAGAGVVSLRRKK